MAKKESTIKPEPVKPEQNKHEPVKSAHAKGTAFPVAVCDAIRHHIGEIKVLEAERLEAFNRRDAAIEQKKALKDRDSKEYYSAARDHSDAVDDIEAKDTVIKFHRGEIARVVKQSDDPQLELKLEPPDPEAEQLPLNPDDVPKKKRKDVAIDPAKPVGRVPKTVDPLDRPIGDLDLRQDIRSRLATSTFKTVRELARVLDHGKGTGLEEVLDMNQRDVLAVKWAVQEMRDEAAAKK